MLRAPVAFWVKGVRLRLRRPRFVRAKINDTVKKELPECYKLGITSGLNYLTLQGQTNVQYFERYLDSSFLGNVLIHSGPERMIDSRTHQCYLVKMKIKIEAVTSISICCKNEMISLVCFWIRFNADGFRLFVSDFVKVFLCHLVSTAKLRKSEEFSFVRPVYIYPFYVFICSWRSRDAAVCSSTNLGIINYVY